MRERLEELALGFLAVVCLWSSSAEAKDYKLYYLGGQSNMDGFGYVKDLQEQNAEPVKGVMMFHGNQGLDCQAETVRQAQADFVKHDENAAIVISTDEYNYSDPWHYDSAGYLDLGEKFADAVHARNSRRN